MTYTHFADQVLILSTSINKKTNIFMENPCSRSAPLDLSISGKLKSELESSVSTHRAKTNKKYNRRK